MQILENLVTRFMTWKLPESCDACITTKPNEAQVWGTGADLLNRDEAEAMLAHVLAEVMDKLNT